MKFLRVPRSIFVSRFTLGVACCWFAVAPCGAQTHQVGPSIRELFEASQSFSGGGPQLLNLEKQDLLLVTAPGTSLNLVGGDCLEFNIGKLLLCTGERTIELKARGFYFELLNDTLAILEMNGSEEPQISIIRGPGAVVSFTPQGTDKHKEVLQVHEQKRLSFNKQNAAPQVQPSQIKYSDDWLVITEDKIGDWEHDTLFKATKDSSSFTKRLTALLKRKR